MSVIIHCDHGYGCNSILVVPHQADPVDFASDNAWETWEDVHLCPEHAAGSS